MDTSKLYDNLNDAMSDAQLLANELHRIAVVVRVPRIGWYIVGRKEFYQTQPSNPQKRDRYIYDYLYPSPRTRKED